MSTLSPHHAAASPAPRRSAASRRARNSATTPSDKLKLPELPAIESANLASALSCGAGGSGESTRAADGSGERCWSPASGAGENGDSGENARVCGATPPRAAPRAGRVAFGGISKYRTECGTAGAESFQSACKSNAASDKEKVYSLPIIAWPS